MTNLYEIITADMLLDELLSYSKVILDGNYNPDMADVYLGEIAHVIRLLDDKIVIDKDLPTRWT